MVTQRIPSCFLSGILVFILMFPVEAQEVGPAIEKGVVSHVGMDAIYRTFAEGQKSNNAAILASVYAEDAVLLAPGANIIKGRTAIEEWYRNFCREQEKNGLRTEVANRILVRHVAGDVVYDIGLYTLSAFRDGKLIWKAGGKFMNIARRMPDGTWKEVADSFSDVPEESGRAPQTKR